MQTIRQLYQAMKDPQRPIPRRQLFQNFYDIQNPVHKDKKRIIFVNPRINKYNLFNMIAPCLYLNLYSQKITCLIAGMSANKQELDISFDPEDNIKLDRSEIQLANMIIFPFSGDDLLPIFAQIRHINPFIKIAYCIDFNYYHVPEGHFQYNTIRTAIPNIERNIKGFDHMPGADFIFISSEELQKYIQDHLGGDTLRCEWLLMPQLFIEGKDLQGNDLPGSFFADINLAVFPTDRKRRRIRIGVFADEYRMPDLVANKNVLLWLQTEHEKYVEVCYYGYHPPWSSQARNPIPVTAPVAPITPTFKSGAKSTKKTKAAFGGKPVAPEKPKLEPKDNYTRLPREQYQYNFKNFYNHNFDLILCLYDRKSDFWKYNPIDMDLVQAVRYEKPVLTNMDNADLPVAKTEAAQKKWLDKYIKVQKDWIAGDPDNEFKKRAVELLYGPENHPELGIVQNLVWSPTTAAYIEEFLLDCMKPNMM